MAALKKTLNMLSKYLLLIISLAYLTTAQAQLYIETGGDLNIRNAVGGLLRDGDTNHDVALFIDGDILNEGTLDNDATEIQFSGDFTNNGTFITSGDEVLFGGVDQALNGAFAGSDDFRNLILNKTPGTYVDLNTKVEIDASGVLEFGQGGIIRNNGNLFYLKNFLVNSISGQSTPGTNDKYIEGTLRRNVIAGAKYSFPVGDNTHFHQAAELLFTNLGGATSADVSYTNAGFGAISDNLVCDVDGDLLDDTIFYDEQLGTWKILADGVNGTYDYQVTLMPGGLNKFTAPTHDAMLKDGVHLHCSSFTGNTTASGLTDFSNFTMQAGSIIHLPVDLVSFKASNVENSYIALDWEVVDEVNVRSYIVERSEDGVLFRQIGQVHSEGDNSSIAYNFDDLTAQPNINYYYRLWILEHDGSYRKTHTVTAKLRKEGVSISSVFPNPGVPGLANIELGSKRETSISLSVYDALGRELHEEMYSLTRGLNELTLDTRTWASGLYRIVVRDADDSLVSENLLIMEP